MSSMPETPSIAAWCTSVGSATRSSGRPWMSYSSHSGRAAVEWARHDPGNLFGALPLAAAGRERKFADVEIEVEIWVLDPVRPRNTKRHRRELAAKRRQTVQPWANQPAHILNNAKAAAWSGGRFHYREKRHMPEVPGILDV